MTRLTLHTIDTSPAASRPLVEKAIANNGYLPNLIGVLANAPVALETYLTVAGINGRASLTLAQREAVQITAALIHGCDFCVAGHSALTLKKAGQSLEVVRALQRGSVTGNTELDVLVAFTRALIARRGAVDDADYEAFIAGGYDEQQALEVVLGVSLATLCNFANSLAGTPVNPELTPYLPGAL